MTMKKDQEIKEQEKPVTQADIDRQNRINFATQALSQDGYNRGLGGFLKDTGLSLISGAVAVPEMAVGLLDIPTGGRVGKFLENEDGMIGFRPSEARQALNDWKSDEAKMQMAQYRNADGVMAKAGKVLSNPTLLTDAIADSAPMMGAGAVIGRGIGLAHKGLSALSRGAWGEGVAMAGSSASQQRAESKDGLLNTKQTLGAIGTGVAGAGFGYLGGRLAQKWGVDDIDTAMVRGSLADDTARKLSQEQIDAKLLAGEIGNGTTNRAVGGLKGLAKGAVLEGFAEELPQTLSETAINNWANDRPLMQDVTNNAVLATLSGMAMGSPTGAISGVNNAKNNQALQQRLEQLQQAQQNSIAQQSPANLPTVSGNDGYYDLSNIDTTPTTPIGFHEDVAISSANEHTYSLPSDTEQTVGTQPAPTNLPDVANDPNYPLPTAQSEQNPQSQEMPTNLPDVANDEQSTPQNAPLADVSPQAFTNPQNFDSWLNQDEFVNQYKAQQEQLNAPKPSETLGLDPNQGTLSRSAIVAVDSGASPVVEQTQEALTSISKPPSAQTQPYHKNNPYANYTTKPDGTIDEKIKQNADNWENRLAALTPSKLEQFNAKAQQEGFNTYVENHHAGLGVFKADKYVGDYHVDIDGYFKNNDGQTAKDDPTDFTAYVFYQGEHLRADDGTVIKISTNNLDEALQQSEKWLKDVQNHQNVLDDTVATQKAVADEPSNNQYYDTPQNVEFDRNTSRQMAHSTALAEFGVADPTNLTDKAGNDIDKVDFNHRVNEIARQLQNGEPVARKSFGQKTPKSLPNKQAIQQANNPSQEKQLIKDSLPQDWDGDNIHKNRKAIQAVLDKVSDPSFLGVKTTTNISKQARKEAIDNIKRWLNTPDNVNEAAYNTLQAGDRLVSRLDDKDYIIHEVSTGIDDQPQFAVYRADSAVGSKVTEMVALNRAIRDFNIKSSSDTPIDKISIKIDNQPPTNTQEQDHAITNRTQSPSDRLLENTSSERMGTDGDKRTQNGVHSQSRRASTSRNRHQSDNRHDDERSPKLQSDGVKTSLSERVELTGQEFGDFDAKTDDNKKRFVQAVKSFLNSLKGKRVYNASLDADIVITTTGINKTIKFSGLNVSAVKMQAMAKLLDILKTAQVQQSNPSYDEKESRSGMIYHDMTAPFTVNGVEYVAKIVVRQDNNGHFYYDFQVRDSIDEILKEIDIKKATKRSQSFNVRGEISGSDSSLSNTDNEVNKNADFADYINNHNTLAKAAKAYFDDHLKGKAFDTVIGKVHVLGSSWQKKLKFGINSDPLQAHSIPHIPDILANGDYEGRNELTKDRKDDFIAFHSFVKEINANGVPVFTRLLVGEKSNKQFEFVVYSIYPNKELLQKETPNSSGLSEVTKALLGDDDSITKSDDTVNTAQAIAQDTEQANTPLSNFVIDELDNTGTMKDKLRLNLDIMDLLKVLERENRPPTADEKALMVRYTGFGGMPHAFPKNGVYKDKTWQELGERLKATLSDSDYKTARSSTTSAFYTPPSVIKAMWGIAERLGFHGGTALEPSVGVGSFVGFAPQNTTIIGTEIDKTSHTIAKHLYPNAHLYHQGYETLSLASGSVDLAIGNPPYGSVSLHFKDKNRQHVNGLSIANQFMVDSLDKVKAGGLSVMVVSSSVMDATTNTTRKLLAQRGELIGAIRLPDSTFSDAGTAVVADILVFKKHDDSTVQANISDGMDYPSWVTSGKENLDGENEVAFNPYFHDKLAGELVASRGEGGRADYAIKSHDIDKALDKFVKSFAKVTATKRTKDEQDKLDKANQAMIESLTLDADGLNAGDIFANNGVLYQVVERSDGQTSQMVKRELTADSVWSENFSQDLDGRWYKIEDLLDDKGKPVKIKDKNGKATKLNQKTKVYYDEKDIHAINKLGEKGLNIVTDALNLHAILKEQYRLESTNAPTSEIENNRAKLNQAYDSFVATHNSRLNSDKNKKYLSQIKGSNLILALEKGYQPDKYAGKGKARKISTKETAQKADVFSKRVIVPHTRTTKADTAKEALTLSLAYTGRLDLDMMSELTGKDKDTVVGELMADNVIFLDPATNGYVTRDEYLSGNVKQKLRLAKEQGLNQNVAELEAVLPKDVPADDISMRLGMNWITPQVYGDFAKHILDNLNASVDYEPTTNTYSVSGNATFAKNSEFGGGGKSVEWLLDKILNNRQIRITDTIDDGGKKTTELNVEKTEEAIEKADEIKRAFSDWLYNDPNLVSSLAELYNETHNAIVPRKFDGSHLELGGKVPDDVIKLRTHQKNAIWRGVTTNAVLYDHAVGAGKTFAGIARAMERKRLGLSKKPVLVVPNHMIEQFAQDVYRLYPSANILAAGQKDFAKKNRKRLFGRIAANDYDIIILPHSSFEFIKLSPQKEIEYMEQDIDDIVNQADMLRREKGNPMSIKELETLADKMKTKLRKLKETNRYDDELSFEDMGIDDITVDEAHEFKNLFFMTKMQGVKGLGSPQGSNKAYDLFQKVRYLHDHNGSVAFMTGTPISNSAAEMHTMMRYLMPNTLKDRNLWHFDAWANTYAENQAKFEATESGQLKLATRFAREWQNLGSLMNLWQTVTDSVTNEDIKATYKAETGKEFPLPRVATGNRQSVAVKPSDSQDEILAKILAGYAEIEAKTLDKEEAGVLRLKLMDLATKNAIDPRIINPNLGAGNKLQAVSDKTVALYHKWADDKGTQIIFLDRSVPKSKGDDKRIAEYQALQTQAQKAQDDNDDDALRRVMDKLDGYDHDEMAELISASNGGFTAYDEIKRLLIAQGIPADEIAFVQDADNDEKKKELFAKVNSGDVRVIIGSTPRMGAGTNIQERLVGLHHVDVGWRPSDTEQREGRIIRQGNKLYEKYGHDNFEVEIFAYVTERTADAKRWDTMSAKINTFNAIKKYDGQNTLDFGDDSDTASFAEIAATATGNPLMRERVELVAERDKLERSRLSHQKRQSVNKSNLNKANQAIDRLPEQIKQADTDKASYDTAYTKAQSEHDKIGVTIDGTFYTERKSAESYIRQAYDSATLQGKKAIFDIDGQKVQGLSGATDVIKKSPLATKSKSPIALAYQGKSYTKVDDMLTDEMIGHINDHTARFRLFGLDVESMYTFGNKTLLSATNAQGHEIANVELDPNATHLKISNAIYRLNEAVKSAMSGRKENLQKQLKQATDTANALAEQTDKPFEQQARLDEVKARLEAVTNELAENGQDENQFRNATLFNELIDDLGGKDKLQPKSKHKNAPINPFVQTVPEIRDDELTQGQLSALASIAKLPDSDPNKAKFRQEIYALDRTDDGKDARREATSRITNYELISRKQNSVADNLRQGGYTVTLGKIDIKTDESMATLTAKQGDETLNIVVKHTNNNKRVSDPTRNGVFIDDGDRLRQLSLSTHDIVGRLNSFEHRTNGEYMGKNRPAFNGGTDWQDDIKEQLDRLFDDDPALQGFIDTAKELIDSNNRTGKNELRLDVTAYADMKATRGQAYYEHEKGGLIDTTSVRRVKADKPYFGKDRPVYELVKDKDGKPTENSQRLSAQLAKLFDDDKKLAEFTQKANQAKTALAQKKLAKQVRDYANEHIPDGNALFDYEVIERLNDEYHEKGHLKFSKQGARYGTTAQDVLDILNHRFGKDTIHQLQANSSLNIISLAEAKDKFGNIGDDVDGFYTDGTAYLIHDNIHTDMVIPTFLHELGGHGGLQTLMSERAYQSLLNEFHDMVARGDETAKQAKALADKHSRNQAEADSEYLAYLITLASRNNSSKLKSLLNRMVMAIKSFLKAKFGLSFPLTPNDILALSEKMVRERAKTKHIDGRDGVQFSLDEANHGDLIIKPRRTATNFIQARQMIADMLGKPLTNQHTGMVATLSRRSLDKILSGKAVAKSVDSKKHIMAAVNIDMLFENAVLGWVEQDKNNAHNVLGVHRLFAPLLIDNKAYLTKLTVKELMGSDGNRIYSVETLDIEHEKSSVPNMVATAQKSGLTTRYHGASVIMLAQVIDDYNKNNPAPNSPDIQFSLHESADSDFARAVDKVFATTGRIHSKMINLGRTPTAFVKAGLDDVLMMMDMAKLAKIKVEHPEMTADLLKQIPQQLNKPVAIFKNTKAGSPPNSYVALTELMADNGHSVIVAIHANKTKNRLEFNKIASIYGRNSSKIYIKNMVKFADVRFVDKQKANRVTLELQLLDENTLSLLFDKAIVTKDDEVGQDPTHDNLDIQFSRMAEFYDKNQDKAKEALDKLGKVASDFINNPKSFIAKDTLTTLKNKSSDHLDKFLQFLGRRQLVELFAKKLDGLKAYSDRVAQMDADSNENAFRADKLAVKWGKLKDEQALAKLMHDVTLSGIDPSLPIKGQNNAKAVQLKKRYEKLSDEAREIFNQARDDYQNYYKNLYQAMSDRVKRNTKLSDERKTKLLDTLDKQYQATKQVFFPLTRFGDYVVVVKDTDGNVVNVTRAETKAKADEIRRELIRDNPNHKVGQVVLGRDMDIKALGGVKGLAVEFLSDELDLGNELHQAYLNSLLDRQFATNNIELKNTAGFSQNARRAYAYHMSRGGYTVAKLRHTDLLKSDLQRMQADVDSNVDNPDFDHISLQRVVDEMEKRHKLLINPPSNPLSTMATSLGFLWYMGLSPASALVNVSQTFLVALPFMGAKFGGIKSAKMLGEVSKLLATNKNDLTDVLTGDEKKAFDEAVRREVIDMTSAHDLAGIANGEDSRVSKALQKPMKIASFMFHHAEKYNRQVTYLASYRLGIEQGLTSEQAMEQAIRLTYDSHFDYASSNRPRFMQGNWQKVLFLFKQYAQNMLFTLTRQTYLAFKGETAQERAEARKILAGILGGHAVMAGALGLPSAITVPFLVMFSALGGDDDDELTDNETEFRNALAKANLIGDDMAEVIAKGVPRAIGADLSGRVGLDSLILPRIQEGLEGQRLGENILAGLMGPVAGIGISVAKGVDQYQDGQKLPGIENMLPKALRDPLKAYRYATDGNVDKHGIEIVARENIGISDIAQQAIGFRSGKFAQAQETKSAIYQADKQLTAIRSDLVRHYALAKRDGDEEQMDEIWQKIQRFNAKYPANKITKPKLMQYIRQRQKKIDNAKDGLYLSKNREHLREVGAFGVS